MRRPLALLAFALLLWQAGAPEAWSSRNPTPADEYAFEASRHGFEPVRYPGPLTREDFLTVLLRREGDWRIPATINYREWRMAEPADLWEAELPGVAKLRIADASVRLERAPAELRLTAGRTYNLPLLARNDTGHPVEIKTLAVLAGEAFADRFELRPGFSYLLLNLRPTRTGRSALKLETYVGIDAPDEGAPPESLRMVSATIPAETVGAGRLRLRVLQDGRPVAARITVFGSDGLAYAPDDGATLSKITWSAGEPFYYGLGDHEIALPAGPARVRVVRGFETEPGEADAEILPGRTAEATVELHRFADMAADGWWSADSHIHANYNDHEIMTPTDMLLQTAGEDLNLANLMVANSTGPQIHDEAYFEGKPHALSTERHVLRWIEEMRSNFYGHMCLPGIQRLVKPLYTGFSDSPQPWDDPPNYYMAKATQEAGGVASYAHPGYRFTDDPFTMSARELPVDAALGAVEAMDVLSNSNERAVVPYYYRLLDSGLRLVISGGSDSFTNRRRHWLAGGQRVYVHTGDATFDERAWIDGYRAGRSFASNGPLLTFSVDGNLPGEEIAVEPGRKLRVRASARSLAPLSALELVVNGQVVAEARGSKPARELELDHLLQLDGPAWIAVRADGGYDPLVVNDARLFAHSTPVWATVAGRRYVDPAAARFFVGWIDRLIAGVRERGKFPNEQRRQAAVELFQQARAYYEAAAQGRP
ncbi:MAG: hypothetical protein GC160_17865 [Acidobacteria bacterium]|nr:hypothetical protein [Acidobacteriota bacterium]